MNPGWRREMWPEACAQIGYPCGKKNGKIHKDPGVPSLQDDWECKGTLATHQKNEEGHSSEVLITQEEVPALRQVTSHNLLQVAPRGHRPYWCRTGFGRINLFH